MTALFGIVAIVVFLLLAFLARRSRLGKRIGDAIAAAQAPERPGAWSHDYAVWSGRMRTSAGCLRAARPTRCY